MKKSREQDTDNNRFLELHGSRPGLSPSSVNGGTPVSNRSSMNGSRPGSRQPLTDGSRPGSRQFSAKDERPRMYQSSGNDDHPGSFQKSGIYSTATSRQRNRRRVLPLGWVILFDTMLLGLGLVVFALFHHVLPRELASTEINLPGVTDEADPVTSDNSTEQVATLPNGAATLATDTTIATSDTIPSSSEQPGTPTRPPSSTVADPSQTGGLWAAKFADHFTSGAVEKTATSYRSAHVSIELEKVQGGGVTYYLADIYLSDLRYFRTAFANDKYGRGFAETVLAMGQKHDAILAVNGDYYGIRNQGVVIRNGKLYRQTAFRDVMVMNNDGSMQTFAEADFDIRQVIAKGAWQAWSFGPMMLDKNGRPMTEFNSDVRVANPRTAIGYYEPGHYCLLLVDGRQPGYSNGLSLKEMSQLFYKLGCKAAYNLDGGQSSVMTFQGEIANQPYNGGRKSSDIIYIQDQ